ncbi:MAG: hypothetical protein IKE43_05735 [Coriobacteriales bacterium]|nr:hypothetical protein [Coriobacteriales bacterium]
MGIRTHAFNKLSLFACRKQRLCEWSSVFSSLPQTAIIIMAIIAMTSLQLVGILDREIQTDTWQNGGYAKRIASFISEIVLLIWLCISFKKESGTQSRALAKIKPIFGLGVTAYLITLMILPFIAEPGRLSFAGNAFGIAHGIGTALLDVCMIAIFSSFGSLTGMVAYLLGRMLPHVINMVLLGLGIHVGYEFHVSGVVTGCVLLIPALCTYYQHNTDSPHKQIMQESYSNIVKHTFMRFPVLFLGLLLFTMFYMLISQTCAAYEVGAGIVLPPTAFTSELVSVIILALAFVPIIKTLSKVDIETYFTFLLPIIALGVALIPAIDIELLWLPWSIVKHASLLYLFIVGAFLVHFPFEDEHERLLAYVLSASISDLGSFVGLFFGYILNEAMSLDTTFSMVASAVLIWATSMVFGSSGAESARSAIIPVFMKA